MGVTESNIGYTFPSKTIQLVIFSKHLSNVSYGPCIIPDARHAKITKIQDLPSRSSQLIGSNGHIKR